MWHEVYKTLEYVFSLYKSVKKVHANIAFGQKELFTKNHLHAKKTFIASFLQATFRAYKLKIVEMFRKNSLCMLAKTRIISLIENLSLQECTNMKNLHENIKFDTRMLSELILSLIYVQYV